MDRKQRFNTSTVNSDVSNSINYSSNLGKSSSFQYVASNKSTSSSYNSKIQDLHNILMKSDDSIDSNSQNLKNLTLQSQPLPHRNSLTNTSIVTNDNSFNNKTRSTNMDDVIILKMNNHSDLLICYRNEEERKKNSERMNLNNRSLRSCPLIQYEDDLRLLSLKSNCIQYIQNIENLKNLILLDIFDNQIQTLEGSLNSLIHLRVLMAGKNRISRITNLNSLRKLDVLDLHSNNINVIEGLDHLHELRVLNLSNNYIHEIKKISPLYSLVELNLKGNYIESINDLDKLILLQRLYLSDNKISHVNSILCIFHLPQLLELTLDGNPLEINQLKEIHHLISKQLKTLKFFNSEVFIFDKDETHNTMNMIRDINKNKNESLIMKESLISFVMKGNIPRVSKDMYEFNETLTSLTIVISLETDDAISDSISQLVSDTFWKKVYSHLEKIPIDQITELCLCNIPFYSLHLLLSPILNKLRNLHILRLCNNKIDLIHQLHSISSNIFIPKIQELHISHNPIIELLDIQNKLSINIFTLYLLYVLPNVKIINEIEIDDIESKHHLASHYLSTLLNMISLPTSNNPTSSIVRPNDSKLLPVGSTRVKKSVLANQKK